MTNFAGNLPAPVMTAFPGGKLTILLTICWHFFRMLGPPARWIAPSTPPPPSREEFAALTMASVVSLVMSAGPSNSTDFWPGRERRIVKELTPLSKRCKASGTRLLLLVGQGFHAGKLFALQELQRRASAGGNVGNVFCYAGSVYCRYRVAT